MANREHELKWVEALRTTTRKQGTGQLGQFIDGEMFACCLEIGCEAAGFEPTFYDRLDNPIFPAESRFPVEATHVAFYDNELTAPYEFGEWLNAREDYQDPMLDIPDDYRDQDGEPYKLRCSTLNDALYLSFAQIADLIEYFGVK